MPRPTTLTVDRVARMLRVLMTDNQFLDLMGAAEDRVEELVMESWDAEDDRAAVSRNDRRICRDLSRLVDALVRADSVRATLLPLSTAELRRERDLCP